MEVTDFVNAGLKNPTAIQQPTLNTGSIPQSTAAAGLAGNAGNLQTALGVNPFQPGTPQYSAYQNTVGLQYAPTSGVADTPGSVNQYGVAYNSGNYASDTLTDISRQDYSQYQQDFQPLEQRLASMVNNTGYDQGLVNSAYNAAGAAGSTAAGTNQRSISRLGLTSDPTQQASYQRLNSENTALNQVNAVNQTNRGIGNLENTILGGAGGSPVSQTLSQLPANALYQ